MSNNKTGQRLASLRAKMQEVNVDLIALGPGAHMQWLLGFHPHADERVCLLLVGLKGESFLMPALNAQEAGTKTNIAFFTWSDDQGPLAALDKALRASGAEKAKSVALDETMRADFALLLLGRLAGAQYRFTADTLGALRMRKDETEYACLKQNALIADKAMLAGFDAIRPGMSEKEIKNAIKDCFNAENTSMLFAIIGAGPNGAFPHHQTGERIVRPGDAIVMDIGGTKDGYQSDMTRMAVIGQPPEGYDEIHRIVENAVLAAVRAARPGVRASVVDAAARGVIAEAGYGEYFIHRTGHGLGIEGHEPPFITATSNTILEPGMVFSIEPGIYLPGRFGIRLEDIFILGEDGPKVLSALPRDVHIVPGK